MPRPTVAHRTTVLASLLVAIAACGGTGPTPGSVGADGATKLAITGIGTEDAEVRAALRDHAAAALPGCDALAADGPRGHLELSVEVDAAGQTEAGILHTTLGRDELAECVARALTGVAMPARGTSYRVRIRLEGR